jgi:hypothetical protein
LLFWCNQCLFTQSAHLQAATTLKRAQTLDCQHVSHLSVIFVPHAVSRLLSLDSSNVASVLHSSIVTSPIATDANLVLNLSTHFSLVFSPVSSMALSLLDVFPYLLSLNFGCFPDVSFKAFQWCDFYRAEIADHVSKNSKSPKSPCDDFDIEKQVSGQLHVFLHIRNNMQGASEFVNGEIC